MNTLADIQNFLALLGRLPDGWCLRRRLEDRRRPHRACQAPDPEPGTYNFQRVSDHEILQIVEFVAHDRRSARILLHAHGFSGRS